MLKHLAFLPLLLGLATFSSAQSTNSFPLWPDGAPGALGNGSNDIPTLTPFLPDPAKAAGLTHRSSAEAVAAIVICPGGGYGGLADHEGSQYARWFNELGIAGFVLKYRLGSAGYRHPAMLNDAARALRTVRARAGEWNVDPKRIGIIGSSAGGHLASTLVTHFDAGKPDSADPIERVSSRPDLGILCYPVITMTDPHAHKGSRKNLLGTNPPAELTELLSNEKQVTKETPPCFLWHTWEDNGVHIENAMMFAAALQAAHVRFEIHVYERGPHGLGLGTREWNPEARHPWTRDCAFWLKERGFTK
jgi:acetyl esterase/lipase